MKKILIIEDDLNIAELERDYLQLNGFDADIAQDGAKGQAAHKRHCRHWFLILKMAIIRL